MNTFNKYNYLEDINNELINEINAGNIQTYDDIQEYILTDIDNQVIYYSDCFDICRELNATDFTAYASECNNISQLAYQALYEFICDELDTNKLGLLINELETLKG
jgi:hypothetical protein